MEDSPDTSKASTTRESFLPDMYLKKMTRDNGGMNKQMRRPVDENKLEEWKNIGFRENLVLGAVRSAGVIYNLSKFASS